MKQFFNYTLVLAVALFTLASCKKEVEDIYTPASPEQADCMQVYFPNQEASGTHQLDPTDPTEVTILVSRPDDKSSSAAKVAYSLQETKDGETVTGIFSAGDIEFAAGQTETSFILSFDNTEVGFPYTCTIVLEEGSYASVYSGGASRLTYGVTRVKWNKLGTGLWREDVFSGTMGNYVSPANPVWEVTVYERDDLPGMYRVYDLYNEKHITSWLADKYKDYHDGLIDGLYIEVNATNPNKVWIPYTFIGWWFYSNGPFYFGSLVDENLETLPDMSGYTSADNYGTDNEGLITFPARGLCYGFSDEEWWGRANTNGMLYLALPGVTPVDYSIKLASSLTEEGVSPITVTVGMDVANVKYAVYEGELNAAQAANRGAAIIDGSDASEDFSDFTPNAVGSAKIGTLGLTCEDTGIYTVVAVSYDEKGEEQNIAHVSFTYVSAENPVPVIINCGLEVTGKYGAQGYTKENSLEYYIYGEDIVDAKIGVYKYLDIVSKGFDTIVASLKGSKSVSADILEEINNGGYVDIASGLVPGTEFYLFVWASNGFEDTVIYSDPATTEGDPLPIYQEFTNDNYETDFEIADRSGWLGEWNLYGVNAYGSLGMREYLGKAVITESETETEGPDDDGLYDEYVYVSGLFGDLSWAAAYGYDIDDRYEMDVYGGCMYTCSNEIQTEGFDVYLYSKGQNSWGWDYAYAYWTYFIPVMDGYYAFVDWKYGSSYNFTGLGLYNADAGWFAKVSDQLLVDPAKDDNGVSPTMIAAAIDAAQKRFAEAAAEVISENTVPEAVSAKEQIHKIIDRYNQKSVCNYFKPANMENVQFTPKQVKVKAVSMGTVCVKEETPGAPGLLAKEAR